MSDAPLGPHWWQAGDGKWYPAPPGLADDRTWRAPTPAPDHAPEPPVRRAPLGVGVYGAGRVGTPPPTGPPTDRRGRRIALGVVAVFLVAALVAGVTELVSRHSGGRASSNDPTYQQAMVDLLGSETTNEVFLETFWDDYTAHLSGGGTGSATRPGRSAAVTVDAGWLDDMQAQVDQFSTDLDAIDKSLAERPWRDGTIADEIRDLARDHYAAWKDWTEQLPDLARQWLAEPPSAGLTTWLDRNAAALEDAIDDTFTALCDALQTTAPADGRFDATIAGICAG